MLFDRIWNSKNSFMNLNLMYTRVLIFPLSLIINFFLIFKVTDNVISKKLWGFAVETNLLDFDNLLNGFGQSDANAYTRIGLNLAANSKISTSDLPALNFWPPGQMILNFFIFRVFDTYLWGFIFPLIIVFLWCSSVWLIVFYINDFSFWQSLFSFLIIFLYIYWNNWVLGIGIFFTEATSIPFFIFFLTLLFKALSSNKAISFKLFGVLSGATLTISSLFRAQFYLVLLFVITSLLILSISRIKRGSLESHSIIQFTLGFISSAILIIGPYLHFAASKLNRNLLSLVDQGYRWTIPWINLESDNWLSLSGGGWACSVSGLDCASINTSEFNYPRETMQLVISEPIAYVLNRVYFFAKAWFSKDSDAAVGSFNFIIGGILLIVFFLFAVYLDSIHNKLRVFFVIIILFAFLLPLGITQIEVRYLASVKFMFLLYTLLVFFEKRKEVNHA